MHFRLQSANGSQAVAPVATGSNSTLTLAQFNQALSNGSASGEPATAESLSNSTLALATVGALLPSSERLLPHAIALGSAQAPRHQAPVHAHCCLMPQTFACALGPPAQHAASRPSRHASAFRGANQQPVPVSTACRKMAKLDDTLLCQQPAHHPVPFIRAACLPQQYVTVHVSLSRSMPRFTNTLPQYSAHCMKLC